MHLYLADKMVRLKVDAHTFFRIAHQWAFERLPMSLHLDVVEYKERGKIPPYVERYVIHLQKGDRDAMQAVSRAN